MKLIIQIPCFNEAETLPRTIQDLPRAVAGFDTVEFLVVDDGSTDGTAEVARASGVNHVISLPRNRGLAHAFAVGLEEALRLGADVVVNTDGDNQYRGDCVPDLVAPILAGQADMVIGDRQVRTIPHFSRLKKLLQRFGSWVVRWTSGTGVPDATSGFRAFSREAAMRLVVFSSYTYTLETIIQAGKKGLTVHSVPVKTNEKSRESRLIRSIPSYVARSAVTILRIFVMYEALKVFISLGTMFFMGGFILSVRYLYFFLIGEGQGHVQSLILASILLVMSFQSYLLGILGDLIAKNRHLLEEANYRLKRIDLDPS